MNKPKFQMGNKVVDLDNQATIMTIIRVGGDKYRAAINSKIEMDFDQKYECEWTSENNNLLSATFHEDQLKLVAFV